ncbi:MAG: hypothetical protein ACTSUJ_05385 [Candidatus Njordarchaeales archaeon]
MTTESIFHKLMYAYRRFFLKLVKSYLKVLQAKSLDLIIIPLPQNLRYTGRLSERLRKFYFDVFNPIYLNTHKIRAWGDTVILWIQKGLKSILSFMKHEDRTDVGVFQIEAELPRDSINRGDPFLYITRGRIRKLKFSQKALESLNRSENELLRDILSCSFGSWLAFHYPDTLGVKSNIGYPLSLHETDRFLVSLCAINGIIEYTEYDQSQDKRIILMKVPSYENGIVKKRYLKLDFEGDISEEYAQTNYLVTVFPTFLIPKKPYRGRVHTYKRAYLIEKSTINLISRAMMLCFISTSFRENCPKLVLEKKDINIMLAQFSTLIEKVKRTFYTDFSANQRQALDVYRNFLQEELSNKDYLLNPWIRLLLIITFSGQLEGGISKIYEIVKSIEEILSSELVTNNINLLGNIDRYDISSNNFLSPMEDLHKFFSDNYYKIEEVIRRKLASSSLIRIKKFINDLTIWLLNIIFLYIFIMNKELRKGILL